MFTKSHNSGKLGGVLSAVCLLFLLVGAVRAAGEVDPAFKAALSRDAAGTNSIFASAVIQPDGKIIALGNFQIAGGAVRNGTARFNADGTLDTSFNCEVCNGVYSAMVQPDGKIIVAGYGILRRLNPDGSADTAFNSPNTPQFASSAVTVWAILPDGKIIASVVQYLSGFVFPTVSRFNSDGSLDSSFTTINLASGRNIYQFIGEVKVQSDGKILIGGGSGGFQSNGFVYRYNSNGTVDSSFEQPIFSNNSGTTSTSVTDLLPQADGSLIILGSFTSINSINRRNGAKLASAGNVDLNFSVDGIDFPTNSSANQIQPLPNGQFLIATTAGLFRLNANGSIDNTFNQPAGFTIGSFALAPNGKIIFFATVTENGSTTYKFLRLNSDGSLDNSFSPTVTFGGTVSALAIQPDGKILTAGDFNKVSNQPRSRFARLNDDGSLDTSFDTGAGFVGGDVLKVVLQPDGKIVAAGNFVGYNGFARPALLRLNADGTLDNAFNLVFSESATVYAVALQTDGKIVFGGSFTSINGTTRAAVARLNADGSLDTTFNVIFSGSPSIRSIAVQPDGKIILGGNFSGINGFNRANIARVNSDGSLDTTFNAGNIFGLYRQIEVQPDGKILVLTSTILRLTATGAADNTFQSPSFSSSSSSFDYVSMFLRQSDNTIIIVGDFTGIGSVARSRIARLQTDGTVDLNFFSNGANGNVSAVARQADGKIVVGGIFTVVGNSTRIGVARLMNLNAAPRGVLFDFDGDGKADISVFRPSTNFWYRSNSGNGAFVQQQFGTATDLIAPADYDSDGKTDLAYFRPAAPDVAAFYIFESATNTVRQITFAQTGDLPVVGDWDGDGRADAAVYREGAGGGQSYFFYRPSTTGTGFVSIPWGQTGDKPVLADIDGDGRQDATVFRPATGAWFSLKSTGGNYFAIQWGANGDIPATGDFDGDGKTDISVFRPSNGSWYRINSSTGQYAGIQFGAAGDVPVAADYDGDGKADVAVWRPANGVWYLLRSTQGFAGIQFGTSGDRPAPAAFVR